MKMFELRVPFFFPLWRRMVVTVICFGWAVMELATGSLFWTVLFVAMGGMATWQFFLSGWPEKTPDQDESS